MQMSPLDDHIETIQECLDEGLTYDQIVRLFKLRLDVCTSEASVRRAIERHGLEKRERVSDKSESPGMTVDGDSAVITGDVNEDLGDADEMIRSRNLNPDEWLLEKVTLNEWEANAGEGEKIKLRQLKIYLKRKIALSFVTPAVEVERLPQSRSSNSDPRMTPHLAVIVGDEQEPYSDAKLKQVFIDWLDYNKPDRGIHLGDLMDFPTVSRHKDNPEWAASVQECLNAGYKTLKAYRTASPDTEWEMLVGNHDERLRNELLLRAERMYGIKPADNGSEQEDALSIKRLLHLDALGVKFIAPRGGYAHASTKLSPLLGVRHGWITGANAAGSTLDRLGHSVIVGHTHHQRVHYKTVYGIDDVPQLLQAVEAGTMCKIEDGLGYTINPNWQQGFATAQVWPDGSFNIELATYSNGVLRWRDQRYEA